MGNVDRVRRRFDGGALLECDSNIHNDASLAWIGRYQERSLQARQGENTFDFQTHMASKNRIHLLEYPRDTIQVDSLEQRVNGLASSRARGHASAGIHGQKTLSHAVCAPSAHSCPHALAKGHAGHLRSAGKIVCNYENHGDNSIAFDRVNLLICERSAPDRYPLHEPIFLIFQ